MSDSVKADSFIDISEEVCPMSFVVTKMELEKLESNQILELVCKAGESLKSISIQVKDEGHLIKSVNREGDSHFRIQIIKDGLE